MGYFELILVLSVAVLVSAVVNQVFHGLAAPLIQIALGVVLVMTHFLPSNITIPPDLFLVLFIAPLLYKEAREVNKVSLWSNRIVILSLALGLVLVTILCVGFSVHWIEPSIPLAAAFALGAALGPTDAVAVTSLSHRVSLKKEQQILLQGECLINDASGVVSFQFAIAAVTTGTFSLLGASVSFVVSFFGGILFGLIAIVAVTFVIGFVRRAGLEDTTFHVMAELVTPFFIFLIAESCHVSGILAVVAAGLVEPFLSQELNPEHSRLNIVSSSVWQVTSFALNGVVFVLLGMQLPRAIMGTLSYIHVSNFEIVFLVILVSFVLFAVRALWFIGISYIDRYTHARTEQEHSGGSQEQVKAVLKGIPFITKEILRDSSALSIAGPKGAITLSIVFTIPYTTVAGEFFPQRDLIIFIASGVILITLLMANFILPLLVPRQQRDKNQDTEAALSILRLVMEELTLHQTRENKRATQMVLRQYNDRIRKIKKTNDIEDLEDRSLRIEALGWEKQFVQDLIDTREVSPQIGVVYIRRINKSIAIASRKPSVKVFLEAFAMRITHRLMYLYKVARDRTPGINILASEDDEMRQLQIKSVEHVVGQLEQLLLHEDSNTEDVASLLIEVQTNLRRLKRDTRTFATAARVDEQVLELRRRAYMLELEAIADLVQDDLITHATAKHMRENVFLMQLDLEEKI